MSLTYLALLLLILPFPLAVWLPHLWHYTLAYLSSLVSSPGIRCFSCYISDIYLLMPMFSARGWVMGLHRGGGGLGRLGGGGAAGGGGALGAAAGGGRPRPRRGAHPRHVRHAAAHPHRLGIQVQKLLHLAAAISSCWQDGAPGPLPPRLRRGVQLAPGQGAGRLQHPQLHALHAGSQVSRVPRVPCHV